MTYECTKNESISSMKRKLKDFLKSPKLIVLEKLNKMSNLGNAIIFNVCEKLYKNKKKKPLRMLSSDHFPCSYATLKKIKIVYDALQTGYMYKIFT